MFKFLDAITMNIMVSFQQVRVQTMQRMRTRKISERQMRLKCLMTMKTRMMMRRRMNQKP